MKISMFIKNVIILLLSMLFCNAFAQVKDLGPVNAKNKTFALSVINDYEKLYDFYKVQRATAEINKISLFWLRNYYYEFSTSHFIENSSNIDTSMYLLKYIPTVVNDSSIVKLDVDKANFSNYYSEPWNEFEWYEVQVDKQVFNKKIFMDSLNNPLKDTFILIQTIPLKFVFRTKLVNGVKSPKLFHVYQAKKQVDVPKPHPAQLWWKDLSDEWKKIIDPSSKLKDFPSKKEIERALWIEKLDLSNSKLNSYDPLSKLQFLTNLNLENSDFDDINHLRNMSNLRFLNVNNTKIKSLKGIDKLAKLEEFFCRKNSLVDIIGVESLSNMFVFDCSENDIETIAPVEKLLQLKEFYFGLNIKIKEINAVVNLENIEKISLQKIPIKDLSPLKKMKNLVYLDAMSTGITSLAPIAHLTKIFYLDLSNNKITSLEEIRNFKYITNLYLNTSSIQDVAVIETFYYLRELDISHCPSIKSLGKLDKIGSIIVLRCHYTGIGKNDVQNFKKSHPDCAITYY